MERRSFNYGTQTMEGVDSPELRDMQRRVRAIRQLIESEKRLPNDAEMEIIAQLDRMLSEPDPRQKDQERAALAGPDDWGTPAPRGKGPFNTPGEQLLAIRAAGSPGGETDPRLYQIRAATGLSTGVGADGGFLLQEDFSQQILSDAIETGKLAKMCNRLTISGNANSIKIPAVDETSRASTRYGGTSGNWTAEAAEKTASLPQIRRLELNLNKLVVLCYSSDELLQDARLAERLIRESAAHEIGFQIDDAIMNGTGAGRPLGILQAGCLVSQDAEAGQGSATIVSENIFNMYSRVINPSNAVWLVNQAVLPELFSLSLSVGTGGAPMFLSNVADSPELRLLGLPLVICEQAADLGTVGDLVLANLRDGYILAEKGGIQSDVSIHVRFIYDESIFRFVIRLDGQPVRASALTPYKSTPTMSHFVALATRP